jgi:hypothetical protein
VSRPRPSDTLRKDADGTFHLRVGSFEGSSKDPDHVAYSISEATGMDRSTAKKLVREAQAIDTPNRCEIAFKNEKER